MLVHVSILSICSMNVYSMLSYVCYLWWYDYDVKFKSNQLRELCFLKSLKLNLCMSTTFIIKPEVAGTMTIPQSLLSHDPTKKYSISHSYIFMSSSEDASVGHDGDFYWVPSLALALWPNAECLSDVYERSYEGLHLLWPSVSGSNYEPIFLPTPTIRRGYPGWHPPILLAAEVTHWWRVRLGYPFDADCFLGFRSFRAILSELSRGDWPIQALLPISDSLTSNSSSSSAASRHVPPPVRGCGFIRTRVMPHGWGVLE